jgi:hypothetical protein
MDWVDGTLSLGGDKVGEANQRCVSGVLLAWDEKVREKLNILVTQKEKLASVSRR